MNLDQMHYNILRLKLKKAEIVLEKNEVIKCQQYEKAADIRDKERNIMNDLAIIQAKLMHYDNSLALNEVNFRIKQAIRNLMIEFQSVDQSFARESLNQTELRISELKKERQVHLSAQDKELAEPLIIELNEQFKLRSVIQNYLQPRPNI
jgi:hypothetical protein